MNTAIHSGLQSSHAQMPFQCGHLGIQLDFIMQSGKYLGLNVSRKDAAVILTHKDVDTSAAQ